MKKSWMAATAAVGAALALGAAPAHAVKVRPLVSFGLTAGGDKLGDVPVSGGGSGSPDSIEVHAGGLVAFSGGLEFQFNELFSAQTTLGYHVDQATARNGDFSFDRFPLEVLGHFRVDKNVRIGGGLRYAGTARLRSSGAASAYVAEEDFKSDVGLVLEGEYLFLRDHLGVKLRFVSEKYKSKTYPQGAHVDGSHVGVFLTYYFR